MGAIIMENDKKNIFEAYNAIADWFSRTGTRD
jgi:hypothetical protein